MAFCDCCNPLESFFNSKTARRDLKRFRKRGPAKQTRSLLGAIEQAPLPQSPTLLDIGGGVGAIHHRLLEQGFSQATHIDAAMAFIDAARDEAQRLGHAGRVSFHHGDFRKLVQDAPEVDVVTLDRVVCCDPDFRTMLGGAAAHARHLVGFTYPRPRWISRGLFAFLNFVQRHFGNGFQAYVHPPDEMAGVLERSGMRRRWAGGTWFWAAEVFER
jgi:magnesium-protoporphyrin O-methyltransferase